MIQGIDLFTYHVVNEKPGQFKAVFNESGIIFFPVRIEHRTVKNDGISYEDDGAGNALAVIIGTRRFEIRRHPAFAPDRVRTILIKLSSESPLETLKEMEILYGGQQLEIK